MNHQVTLLRVRLSFPNLFEAKAGDAGATPRYGAQFLIDGKDKANLDKVNAAIDAAIKEKWPKRANRKGLKVCLKDAGEKADKYDGYEDGNWFLSANRSVKQGRPLVVDRKKTPVTEQDGVVYGGCYVNAGVSIYAMTHPTGGDQVNASLEAVQFVSDGEPFGSAKPTADALPDLPDEEANDEDAI
jgi:hypothetical protein